MPDKEQDSFNLQRFIDAQNSCYYKVTEELTQGKKVSHWIWFIFPQVAGLGHSPTAQKYAIKSRSEAKAYLQNPTLEKRLLESTRLVLSIENSSAEQIFGFPDYLKFHSSMTLFANVAQNPNIFNDALNKFYSGETDQHTLDILQQSHFQ
jgi:uncharacterized protein (DUF1810 family)